MRKMLERLVIEEDGSALIVKNYIKNWRKNKRYENEQKRKM